MKFVFTLAFNESMESEDYGTGEFDWKHGKEIIIEKAWDFDHAAELFLEKFSLDLNEIHDCESFNDNKYGYVKYGNTVDGASVKFKVEKVRREG